MNIILLVLEPSKKLNTLTTTPKGFYRDWDFSYNLGEFSKNKNTIVIPTVATKATAE